MKHLRRELGMTVALVVLGLCIWFSNHAFLGAGNVSDLLRDISMLGIYSVGMAFVIITGGIDLSAGSMVGLVGVIVCKLCSNDTGCLGWGPLKGVSVALAVALLIGLIQGIIITGLNLQPFIVTLAGMMIIRGASQTICKSGHLSLTDDVTSVRDLTEHGFTFHIPHMADPVLISWPVWIFIAVLILFAYLLHFTVYGRYVFAIGGNRDAAKYSGINVKLVEIFTYVVSAGLAGVAGICYLSFNKGADSGVGIAYELYAIAAAVLGGCSLRGGEGSVFGVLVGCSFYQMVTNGIIMFQILTSRTTKMVIHHGVHVEKVVEKFWRVPSEWKDWILGGLLLGAVMLDQIAHIYQAKRRTRKVVQASPAPAPPPPALNTVG